LAKSLVADVILVGLFDILILANTGFMRFQHSSRPNFLQEFKVRDPKSIERQIVLQK